MSIQRGTEGSSRSYISLTVFVVFPIRYLLSLICYQPFTVKLLIKLFWEF